MIIKLICFISEDIKKSDPRIREKLNVVYMENYNVTMSEALMPASEISEQISLAGKEASGTGNMKFMINGALTVGTLDGANVEMAQRVGEDNIFIFGLKADEVDEIWSRGYNSSAYYNQDPELRRIVESLIVGFNGTSLRKSQITCCAMLRLPTRICVSRIMSRIARHRPRSTISIATIRWPGTANRS